MFDICWENVSLSCPFKGETILVLNKDYATKQRAFSFIH